MLNESREYKFHSTSVGMEYLHQQKMMHRDLKSSNSKLCLSCALKLLGTL